MEQRLGRLQEFPRLALAHVPTPIEEMANLSEALGGPRLFVKRDDYTGIGFGGNKVRQLEFYFGAAKAESADTVLITGALQSNYARTAAAIARKLGMACHLQLEERVAKNSALYRTSGNLLLDRLLGATLHSYAEGEDEAGADAALEALAEGLRAEGARPYIVPLGLKNKPLGALGYVVAAAELLRQLDELDLTIDEIIVPSGSAFTHRGLLFGLRALGSKIPVTGVCVRRVASAQGPRVTQRLGEIGAMLELEVAFDDADVVLSDDLLGPGYGLLNDETKAAILLAARSEGLFLDPVYSGKTMAALIQRVQSGAIGAVATLLFLHTGGQPALFAYGDELIRES